MYFIKEPLWLVQGVRAWPCPATKQHQQVLVYNQSRSSFGGRIGPWEKSTTAWLGSAPHKLQAGGLQTTVS